MLQHLKVMQSSDRNDCYCILFFGIFVFAGFFQNGAVFFPERHAEAGVNEAIFNGLQAFVFVL